MSRLRFAALQRLSARDRRALRLGLLVVAPVLLYAGAIRPYSSALTDARARSAAERRLLERELELLAQAPALPRAIADARVKAERAEHRLVRATNAVVAENEVTEYLETMATMSRVLLQELRAVELARGEVPPPGARPLRLALRGESDLEGVLTFLHRVETSPLLLRVTGLSIEPVLERRSRSRRSDEPAEPPATTGVVNFALVVEAYLPPDAAGDATAGREGALP